LQTLSAPSALSLTHTLVSPCSEHCCLWASASVFVRFWQTFRKQLYHNPISKYSLHP
jgi:hypothetical protein